MIYFRVKTTDIDNQYDLCSIICTYVSSILEVVYSTASCAPVEGVIYLNIIIYIASVEGLFILVLEISNVFQNNIMPNTEERVCISLPHIYLEWSKRKWTKHPSA